MKNHKQAEQILIYIHQDIHKVSEQIKILSQTLETIRSRVDSTLAKMEAQENESHRE